MELIGWCRSLNDCSIVAIRDHFGIVKITGRRRHGSHFPHPTCRYRILPGLFKATSTNFRLIKWLRVTESSKNAIVFHNSWFMVNAASCYNMTCNMLGLAINP